MLKVRNNQGFSLVELMVVVAIIGILASVAIPQYSKFQAKARQTEGKALLASVYTAEKGFFVEANGYTGCLNASGVSPEVTAAGSTVNTGHYALGFAAAPAVLATVPAGLQASPPAGATCADGAGVTFWTAAKNAATPSTASTISRTALSNTTTVSNAAGAETFVVSVAGFVSSDNTKNTDAACDQWTVNQLNQVLNTRIGI